MIRKARVSQPLNFQPRPVALLAVVLLALGACTAAPVAQGINDPAERQNREVHALNRAVDRGVLRPASQAYGAVVPGPIRTGVSNFAANLDQPRMVVNGLLQGRVEDAAANTFRFLVNSTFGFAGLLDPATDMGIFARDTDFGETLHVWGVGEGAYVELPLLGPSTGRDAVGTAVDFVLNPLAHAGLSDDARALRRGSAVGGALDSRHRFSATIDGVLYDSPDSYAQARLLYLQNRRFELGGAGNATGLDDLYGDIDADPYGDLYAPAAGGINAE